MKNKRSRCFKENKKNIYMIIIKESPEALALYTE